MNAWKQGPRGAADGKWDGRKDWRGSQGLFMPLLGWHRVDSDSSGKWPIYRWFVMIYLFKMVVFYSKRLNNQRLTKCERYSPLLAARKAQSFQRRCVPRIQFRYGWIGPCLDWSVSLCMSRGNHIWNHMKSWTSQQYQRYRVLLGHGKL